MLAVAWHFNRPPRHAVLDALPDVLRGLAAAAALFGLTGFPLVRLLLPGPLRRHEPLWVLPAGACASGLAMTVLGFAAVPFPASLAIVLAAGAAGTFSVLRRAPRTEPAGAPDRATAPARAIAPDRATAPDHASAADRAIGPHRAAGARQRLAWPAYLAMIVLVLTLIPVVCVQKYAAPVGSGSDAHVAAGAARFLQHAYPTSVDISQPINRMPPTWQSKFPIYYALAGVSSLSGLQTFQALPIVAALLLALTALGMFLLGREVLRAPPAVALAGMSFAALDREAMFTVLNPYFNQTWGFFAMPFTVVLGWWLAQPELSGRERRRCVGLLAVFGLVLVFAYPLAAPLPAVPLAVFSWRERRRRIRAGERLPRLRDLYRGRRSLLWMVPVAAALAFPAAGVVHKALGAAGVLLPGHSLAVWEGDLGHFIPFGYFLSLPATPWALPLVLAVLALAAIGLARQHPSLRIGLGGLLAIGLLLSLYLRQRAYGWYFHFKLLAFIGPLVLLCAAVGAARLRRLAMPALAGLALAVSVSAFMQIRNQPYQLPEATIELSGWARDLPPGASVRLDMWPPYQLWTAYFMDARPLCSLHPLLNTDYPHVPYSRRADFILTTSDVPRPADAAGPPLRRNQGYILYRESASVPGPSFCSRRRLDRIYTGPGYSPN